MGVEGGCGVDEQAPLGDLLVLTVLAERHGKSEDRVCFGACGGKRVRVGKVADRQLRAASGECMCGW